MNIKRGRKGLRHHWASFKLAAKTVKSEVMTTVELYVRFISTIGRLHLRKASYRNTKEHLQLKPKTIITVISDLNCNVSLFCFVDLSVASHMRSDLRTCPESVTCNCFTISNGEMQDVGVGLYPSMSLLNHSCDPNCVIVFEGYQLLLRSVREIQIGEELTISYIESLMPTSERQKQLLRQYCFECDCLLCQNQEKWALKFLVKILEEETPDIVFSSGAAVVKH
ncbi:SET and MYND domain containing 3 [Willisornis vidua]|uniref:SET and MYND domain containing 3 n=1 Tax=Willisornis vidua TaxID=1566151 RepID=A0ABQ9DMW4_9PASS|nr:SET and MYND domain containing 3 [Willisornis vidua]